MRIHLPLHPQHFLPQAAAGPSAPPLVQLGGDLVLVELQGELSWEGDRAGGVVGVLGLDRPDKPTLHLGEHHLLHGKFSNLQKPYAVIRRVVGSPVGVNALSGTAIEGDADEEEDAEEDEAGPEEVVDRTPLRPPRSHGRRAPDDEEDDEADEPPLFPPGSPQTPAGAGRHAHVQAQVQGPESSSPFLPPSSIKDYSSELDFSSPAQRFGSKRDRSDNEDDDEGEDEDDNEEEEKEEEDEEDEETKRKRLKVERKKAERRALKPERTRYYEVVGVVRKKVVFALRPEPIVTATVLPD